MLNQRVLTLAWDIIATARYSGKNFGPRPQGPVELLVKTVPTVLEEGSEEEITRASLEQLSIKGSHEQIERGIVGIYSNMLCNIINASRNDVKPLVDAIYAAVEEKRKSETLAGTGLFKEVVQVTTPRILTDDTFMSLLSQYSDVTYQGLEGLREIVDDVVNANLDSYEVDELALTGSAVVDNKLKEFYNVALGDAINSFEGIKDFTDPGSLTLLELVKLFMILSGVINFRSFKLSSYTEDTPFLNKVVKVRAVVGGALYRMCRTYKSDIDTGRLFCLIPQFYKRANTDFSNDATYVYSDRYKEWVAKDGGNIESILGYIYWASANNKNLYDQQLVGNVKEYEEIYCSRMRGLDISNSLNEISIVKRTAHVFLTNYLNDKYKSEGAELLLYHNRLEHAIEHDYHGPADLFPYLIKVVSRTLYPRRDSSVTAINESDVKDVLLEVHAQTVNQETPNYEEALLLAVIRLATKVVTREIITV